MNTSPTTVRRRFFPALFALAVLASLSSGCSTSYWSNRGRDAADMFTATVGKGVAAQVRLGPLPVGGIAASDICGIRLGGAFSHRPDSDVPEEYDNRTLLATGTAVFYPFLMLGGAYSGASGAQLWQATRGLGIRVDDAWEAFDDFPLTASQIARGKHGTGPGGAAWWRVEACVGIGATVRLGCNPAEMLDFLLGWTSLDLLGDDVVESGELAAGR